VSRKSETFTILKNSWGRFGRLNLLWKSMEGKRLLYVLGIASLAVESLFIFSSPVIIKVTIDSVIGTQAPVLPFPLKNLAEFFLGAGLSGGGMLRLPAGGTGIAGLAEHAWAWRPWFREHLWALALVFVAFILLQAFAGFVASYSANMAAEHAAKNLRDRLYRHVQELPYETLLRSQTGDWLQRCTSDVDTTRRFLAFEFFEMCRTVFLVSIAYPVMIFLDPRMTLWGSIVLPLILFFSIGFHKVVEKVFLGVDEREGVLSGIVQENVTGVRVVRAFARQHYELGRFAEANGRFRDQVFKLLLWLALYWGGSSFLGILQLAIVLGKGLQFMVGGGLTLGTLVLFLTYEQQILWPLRQFGRILADAGKTKVALGRMAELLVLERESHLDMSVPSPAEGLSYEVSGDPAFSVEFRNVGFAYPDGTKVLENISFAMKRGSTLAIVGPTGSGKSTLVHLLLRLYEPTSGSILLDGVDIRYLPKRELRTRIALVLQEGFLFGKTVRDNIRMGLDGLDETELVDAAMKASFHQVAEGFPKGYETMVGERGVTLSGGQKQRLALTRALVRKAPLLVLDDSLSAVDTETDARIREALGTKGEAGSAGMILIAHRLATLASADMILVIENGRITAEGTHRELSERPGLYRRLAELQSAVEAQY